MEGLVPSRQKHKLKRLNSFCSPNFLLGDFAAEVFVRFIKNKKTICVCCLFQTAYRALEFDIFLIREDLENFRLA